MNKPLLIIGKPHSTKTTFIAQVYARLLAKKGPLKLYKPVDNITAIKDASDRLANGDETKTTPTDKSVGLILPIEVQGQKIDLYYPDYGGEQVLDIINNREVDTKWNDAVKESNNWLLFIRIGSLSVGSDLCNKTISSDNAVAGISAEVSEYAISDQSSFIELLQILLYNKVHNYQLKNTQTKLTIVLTCWDEIQTDQNPREVLNQHLPLLLNFIDANWAQDMWSVFGLSAQGFNLTDEGNQQKYLEQGSENYGYLVKHDGTSTNDITELISLAL
jgi:hypothetical protein